MTERLVFGPDNQAMAMTGAHWHLLMNHLPVGGVLLGLALLVVSLRRLDPILQRTGLLVLILAGAVAGLAYLTGEPAEETLEHLGIQTGSAIEAHEEAAVVGLVATATLAILAMAAFWKARRAALGRRVVMTLVLIGVATAGTLAWASNLGGQIRHSEIRSGQMPVDLDGAEEKHEGSPLTP